MGAGAPRRLLGRDHPDVPSDLKRLNEAAVAPRHRARRTSSASRTRCSCTETSITPEENARMTAIGARGRGRRACALFFHAAFGTLEDNIEAVNLAEREGADLALLSYPPQFWPTTEQEVYDYTKAVLRRDRPRRDAVRAARVGLRAHPSRRHVGASSCAACSTRSRTSSPIKSEQGFPLVAGVCEMYHHFRDEVVISCPIEARRASRSWASWRCSSPAPATPSG